MPDDPTRKTSHHDVFISYAQMDKPIADAVCVKLEAQRIRCWMAPRDVPPGRDFPEAIIDGIEGGTIVVLIFSSHANSSPHVIRELTTAVNKGRIIIPFRIEDVTPTKSMEYLISVPHWLDAVTPPIEKHIDLLIHTIECILGTDMAPSQCLAESASKAEAPAAATALTEPGTVFCRSCNAALAPGAKYCESCGAPALRDTAGQADGGRADSGPVTEHLEPPVPVLPAEPHGTGTMHDEGGSAASRQGPGAAPAVPLKIFVIAGAGILLLILAVFAFQSGWFSPAADVPVPAVFTATPVIPEGMSEADYYRGTEARVNTVTLTTEPTRTMAKETELFLDVTKDNSNVVVTVQFNGGPGADLVQTSRVILTRSDGTVTEGKLSFQKRLSTVQLQGSRGTDRLQVIVILHSGEQKTVIDTLLPYRQYH